MIHSQRSHEGYFLRDDRVSGGEFIEQPTRTCSHCHRIVMLNPKRTRTRGYCAKCDSYVCDSCEAIRVKTGECVPLIKVFEQQREISMRLLNISQV